MNNTCTQLFMQYTKFEYEVTIQNILLIFKSFFFFNPQKKNWQ